jgi:transposase-like protein
METCAVEERMRFVDMAVQNEQAFAAICRRFGVSRKTGYQCIRALRRRLSRDRCDRIQRRAH